MLQKVGALCLRQIRLFSVSYMFLVITHWCFHPLPLLPNYSEWIFADPKCIAASNFWQQFPSRRNIPCCPNEGIATYILLHKQIHFCFSRNCWCLWVSFFLFFFPSVILWIMCAVEVALQICVWEWDWWWGVCALLWSFDYSIPEMGLLKKIWRG